MLDLTAIEARVLGALVEKSRTTPDYYPMTLNALTAACNQSSNRQPVTAFTEDEVEDAMRALRDRDVAKSVRTSRSRIMKHQHNVENLLVIDEAATALLAVLLLRGPQTAGELRTRTDRYDAFESLDEVEASLRTMAVDDPPLVVRLDRQRGQKEARWAQLLTAERPEPGDQAPPIPASSVRNSGETISDMKARLAELELRVADLERQLGL